MMKPGFTLTLTKGPSPGKVFRFDKEIVNIGRTAADNDLILNNQSISTHHGRISFVNGGYFLQDSESTNGTVYNGRLLEKNERVKLEHGSEVCFGSICFKFDSNIKKTGKTNDAGSLDRTVLKKIPFKRKGASEDPSPSQTSKTPGFQKKPVIIAALCVGVFLILLIAIKGVDKDSSSGHLADTKADISSKEIELPAREGFGYLPKNKIFSRPDKAVFTFSSVPGSLFLTFTPGYINKLNDVSIALNGNPIAYSPPAPNTWGREKSIHIPRSMLLSTGKNILEFDNRLNPPENNEWAVKNLYIVAQTDCQCDVVEARRLFDLGNNLYNERSISMGNLSAAVSYYSDALLRLDACAPLPDIYHEIVGNLLKSREIIIDQYNNVMFIYKKAVKLKDTNGQIQSLENVMRLIPDTKDPLHESAYTELNKIKSTAGKKK